MTTLGADGPDESLELASAASSSNSFADNASTVKVVVMPSLVKQIRGFFA